MSQAKADQVVEILAKGLMNFANATGDRSMVQAGAIALRDVKDVFVENIRADNTCTFAFPSMVVLPDIRVECFVAILNDRVIVAWRKGLFRKTTVSRVIPKSTIKGASWGVINRPGVTRGSGAALLTIIADDTIDIALPRDNPAVANAILSAVQAK
ncbi:MAG: hypothetical protein ACJ8CB_36020 [Ktedonobacteraceae bacterium]